MNDINNNLVQGTYGEMKIVKDFLPDPENISLKKNKFGVIIGRFQVPMLTPAHAELIDKVALENDEVLILVGQSDTKSTRRYPLGFETVRDMLISYNSEIKVDQIHDHESDVYWSTKVDQKIKDLCGDLEVTLYGGRDSFIPYYSGEFKTVDIGEIDSPSGTDLRDEVSYPTTLEGRQGAIWATYNKWPTMYSVVDAIIIHQNGQVLLCRKEGCEHWNLIGGFVDPTDETLEDSIIREVKEETGLDIAPSYLFSLRIDDRRYAKELDKVISHVFVCHLIDMAQEPKADDDIVEVKWFDPESMPVLSKNHKEILDRVILSKER